MYIVINILTFFSNIRLFHFEEMKQINCNVSGTKLPYLYVISYNDHINVLLRTTPLAIA